MSNSLAPVAIPPLYRCIRHLVILGALTLVTGCGLKGPLYLSDEDRSESVVPAGAAPAEEPPAATPRRRMTPPPAPQSQKIPRSAEPATAAPHAPPVQAPADDVRPHTRKAAEAPAGAAAETRPTAQHPGPEDGPDARQP